MGDEVFHAWFCWYFVLRRENDTLYSYKFNRPANRVRNLSWFFHSKTGQLDGMRTPIFRFWLWLLKKLSEKSPGFWLFQSQSRAQNSSVETQLCQNRLWLWNFFSKSILTLKKLKSFNLLYLILFIIKLRRKLSYKNRRFGLISLEKWTQRNTD